MSLPSVVVAFTACREDAVGDGCLLIQRPPLIGNIHSANAAAVAAVYIEVCDVHRCSQLVVLVGRRSAACLNVAVPPVGQWLCVTALVALSSWAPVVPVASLLYVTWEFASLVCLSSGIVCIGARGADRCLLLRCSVVGLVVESVGESASGTAIQILIP